MSATTEAKLTILSDNHAAPGLEAEHGFALWIHTTAGLVVCLGCCHAGVINTLRHITAASGESRIAAVIGGMHLINATDERLERTTEALKAYAIPSMVPCHCTGESAVAFLAGRLGGCVERGCAGWIRDFN
jgi:7,8-dihydropterin-6-yl-methyl-4-(beta-D-ribofuranosyl)aminobenzene 5'-phosphate synthase